MLHVRARWEVGLYIHMWTCANLHFSYPADPYSALHVGNVCRYVIRSSTTDKPVVFSGVQPKVDFSLVVPNRYRTDIILRFRFDVHLKRVLGQRSRAGRCNSGNWDNKKGPHLPGCGVLRPRSTISLVTSSAQLFWRSPASFGPPRTVSSVPSLFQVARRSYPLRYLSPAKARQA